MRSTIEPIPEPAEFPLEEALQHAWEEDSGDYLRLDGLTIPPEPPPDES
jgi:hypothetical protein